MPYDLTNLQNVTNYLSQQQKAGSYVPTNGSLGKPSMGWDGWNGYNASQTYNPAQTTPAPQSPMTAPAGNPNIPRGPNLNHPMNMHNQGNYAHTNGFNKGNFQGGFSGGNGGGNYGTNNNGQSPMLASLNPAPLSTTLQGVQDYGNQYGQNAYQFNAGINDYQSKLASWQQLANITGQSVDDVAKQISGFDTSYWQKMQDQYDQGMHPTTNTTY